MNLGDPETRNALQGLALIVLVIWNLYQYSRNRSLDAKDSAKEIDSLKSDVEGLKFKVGLVWRLVEDHMSSMLAKANPINLTETEQAEARIYDRMKRNSPTSTLKVLAPAIKRELDKKYMTPDETVVFVCILGAIQSQLYDRGELDGT